VKEAYYFPHDANARTDAKILELRAELGWEGYGLWWALVEQLREASEYKLSNVLTGGLAMGLAISKAELRKLLDLCIAVGLLVVEDDCFYSPSLRRRMAALDAKRQARADSARNAAEKRWQSAGNAEAMRTHCEGTAPAMRNDATVENSRVENNTEEESKEEPLPSVEDAAVAAAPELEKKIDPTPLPESSNAQASHTEGGAADVGTSVGLTKQRGGKPLAPEPEHFAAFWQSYTRHDDRAGAVAAFRKLPLADQEAAASRAAAWLAARPDIVSARGDFRPHPATWLNRRRWADASPTTPSSSSVNPQQNAVYPTAIKPGAARHHVPVVTSYGKL
jgi:hypothetical protein